MWARGFGENRGVIDRGPGVRFGGVFFGLERGSHRPPRGPWRGSVVGLNEAVKTRSGPLVTFRPRSAKRLHTRGLRPKSRRGQPYLMLARFYSSSLGRFMAVDPGDDTALEDPQSWNKYAYVRNNPLKFIDPNGEDAFLCSRPLFDNPRSSSQHMFVVSYAPRVGGASTVFVHRRYRPRFGWIQGTR